MNKIVKKLIYYVIGSIILSLGISLSILSKLGAGAFDALNSNLSDLLGKSIGIAMYISVFIVYIITMILKPKKIYAIGLFITTLVGVEIDTWLKIIPDFSYSIWLGLIYFGAALILLPLGVAFIIKSKLPLSPMDNLLVIIVDKTKWSVTIIKTSIEGSFALFALIYGLSANIGIGALSIGTIVITFSIGPGIEFFMKYVKDIDTTKKNDINKSTFY